MKTVLAFETSTPVLNLALGTPDGKIWKVAAAGAFGHSENLIPLMERLLKEARLSFAKVDAFVIDRGPGSFTGLRIGFSLLKGFLAVRKRPCYGALSLDMMAEKISLPEGSRLGILMDARRGKIYSRFFKRRKGRWAAEQKTKVLTVDELIPRITRETCLAGDGLARYAGRLSVRSVSPSALRLCSGLSLPRPSAETLVEWFQKKDPRLAPLKTPQDFVPLYFRASEAEEKRRAQKP